MPKNQQTTANKPKLSHIENELLEYAKKGQPVLLYGKDTIRRKDLILKIHKMNGGIDASFEYAFFGDRMSTEKEIGEIEEKFYEKLQKEGSIDTEEKIINFRIEFDRAKQACAKSTKRTWDYVDFGDSDGKEIFEALVKNTGESSVQKEIDEEKKADDENRKNNLIVIRRKNKGYLFKRNGTLFVDNISYTAGNNNDEKHYLKLAKIIKNRHHSIQSTTFNWLVVYTPDLEKPPPSLAYFREQFEPVSLGPEKKQDTPYTTPGRKDTPKTEINSDLFLENNHHLKILNNNKFIKLTENLAELVRFMARRDKENKGLDLTEILCFHYGNDVINKMTLSKRIGSHSIKRKKELMIDAKKR